LSDSGALAVLSEKRGLEVAGPRIPPVELFWPLAYWTPVTPLVLEHFSWIARFLGDAGGDKEPISLHTRTNVGIDQRDHAKG